MLVHPFARRPSPTLAEVGGKGLSLIRMTHEGIAIPPGFVLTVGFFEPWLERLRELPEWRAFQDGLGAADLALRCDALKARCADLSFTLEQVELVDDAIGAFVPDALFAVRSSSPEEDLAGASFAGGYETVLGVTRAALEQATRRAFASCLDARVAVYKRENGFDAASPRIAVVVQQQIASEIAGVGFSLDPVSNAYDEAVFNANWGLGETVVGGLASPDLYAVDKPSRTVTRRVIGKKETSIWLLPGGGTEERPDPRHDTATLDDGQVLALTEQLARIESLYGVPMDIEWAWAGGRLYLLQARPITTHLSLPASMVTAPGARRRLYWDLTISVQGFLEPLTEMAMDCWRAAVGEGSRTAFGFDLLADLEHAPLLIENGRLYANLSNVLAFVEKDTLVRLLPNIDPVAAATLATVDAEDYRSLDARRPVPWNLLLHSPEHVAQIFEARVLPEQARRGLDGSVARTWREARAIASEALPFPDFARGVLGRFARTMFGEILPLFVASKVAMKRIAGIFEDGTEEERALVGKLDLSLPHNVTIEMGLALSELATHAPPGLDLDALEAGVRSGSVPLEFLSGWTDFLARYGHRGPAEIDVASPRYREAPRVLLSQIASLGSGVDPGATPRATYERSQRERHEAFERLAEAAHGRGWVTSKRFLSLYRMVEELGGARETPKFCLVLGIDMVRTRALAEADALVRAGRLDAAGDVFHLGFDDLGRGIADPGVDLRALVRARKDAAARTKRFAELPRMIDSRGRIHRPTPRPLSPGELGGFPISPGIVRGAV
jgi:pyruvate,water dikinase